MSNMSSASFPGAYNPNFDPNNLPQATLPAGSSAAKSAEDNITLKAITALQDAVDIDPASESVAELQAIIEKLNGATTASQIRDLMGSLKRFVNQNSNASFSGDMLGKLGKMANDILQKMSDNPGESFQLALSFDFNLQNISSENYYSEQKSFSFSFSFVSESTAINAQFNYSESTTLTKNSVRYLSSETAEISMTTKLGDVASVPVINGFAGLLSGIAGKDARELLGFALPPAPQAVENANSNKIEDLRASWAALFDNIDITDRAKGLLEAMLQQIKTAQDDVRQAA